MVRSPSVQVELETGTLECSSVTRTVPLLAGDPH